MNSSNQSLLLDTLLINHRSILYYERLREPDYFDSRSLFCPTIDSNSSTLGISIFSGYHNQNNRLLSERKILDYEKPKQSLQQRIVDIYDEHQEENWDGYESEPMKYLISSLKFAEIVSSAALNELIDIVPENDGCLCFEWFKSSNKFISISVKDDKLVYNYKIGDEEGCGETTFAGEQMLVEQIKKVI